MQAYALREKNSLTQVDQEYVILSFRLGEFCRRGGEFRGLADDHLSRTSPARFRVPSASQVSAFTLRSRAEISRARARARVCAHARGFLWDRADPRARAIIERLPSSNRSAAIDVAPRRETTSFPPPDISRFVFRARSNTGSGIFRKLRQFRSDMRKDNPLTRQSFAAVSRAKVYIAKQML